MCKHAVRKIFLKSCLMAWKHFAARRSQALQKQQTLYTPLCKLLCLCYAMPCYALRVSRLFARTAVKLKKAQTTTVSATSQQHWQVGGGWVCCKNFCRSINTTASEAKVYKRKEIVGNCDVKVFACCAKCWWLCGKLVELFGEVVCSHCKCWRWVMDDGAVCVSCGEWMR